MAGAGSRRRAEMNSGTVRWGRKGRDASRTTPAGCGPDSRNAPGHFWDRRNRTTPRPAGPRRSRSGQTLGVGESDTPERLIER